MNRPKNYRKHAYDVIGNIVNVGNIVLYTNGKSSFGIGIVFGITKNGIRLFNIHKNYNVYNNDYTTSYTTKTDKCIILVQHNINTLEYNEVAYKQITTKFFLPEKMSIL